MQQNREPRNRPTLYLSMREMQGKHELFNKHCWGGWVSIWEKTNHRIPETEQFIKNRDVFPFSNCIIMSNYVLLCVTMWVCAHEYRCL